MKKLIKIGNYFFAFVLVIVASLLAFVAVPAFGNKALIVRSGSMEPVINVGDLIVVKINEPIKTPQKLAIADYKKDDIVAFINPQDSKQVITHRIVSSETRDNEIVYEVKGDANRNTDINKVPQKNILGKSIITIPSVGKLFTYTKTKTGFLLLILIPALMIIVTEILNIAKEIHKFKNQTSINHENESQSILLGSLGMRVVLPLVVSFMFFQNSYAFFTDDASSLTNSFSAKEIFVSPSENPSPIVSPQVSPSPPPQSIADHIVISEVQITGGSNALNDNDFVELYNPTSNDINLNGMHLVVRTSGDTSDNNIFSFTSAHVITSHGYYLWAHKTSTNNFADTISANVSSADVISGNNSVGLRSGLLDTSQLIDSLSWDSSVNSLKEGTEFNPDPVANQSIERKAYSTSDLTSMLGVDAAKGNGYDANNNSTDFILRSVSQPQNSTSTIETP